MTDDTDQTDRLLNRIEEQQDRIDDLEATVQKMLPSRRQLLAGAGVAGASALTGSALTGGASAAPQGQIGTSSTPVDTIYANTLDVGTAKYDDVDVDTNLALNSLDTDGLNIGDGSDIDQIEFGSVSNQLPGASANDGWDDFASETVTVNFSTSFTNPPTVLADMQEQYTGVIAVVNSVSTSSVDIRIANYGTSDQSNQTSSIGWIAFD